jgi:FkbM family methyltransferase
MLRRILSRYHRWKYDPARRLRQQFSGDSNAFVVQIGSNDGRTGDPIFDLLRANPGWGALLVEPVPFLFERLRRNYGTDPRFHFENAAIGQSPGPSEFYYVSPEARCEMPRLPSYFDQLGSFNRDHILDHFPGLNPNLIITAWVETLTFDDLLAKHRVERVDLLHIDAEGEDWRILKQLNLVRFAPRAILIEHRHLPFHEKIDAMNELTRRYDVEELAGDWLCTRQPS